MGALSAFYDSAESVSDPLQVGHRPTRPPRGYLARIQAWRFTTSARGSTTQLLRQLTSTSAAPHATRRTLRTLSKPAYTTR